MRFNDEQTMQFIRLYEQHPCLWETTSPGYKNRDKRKVALQNIIQTMNMPNFGEADCRYKIKNIRSHYCQELKKIKISIKKGGDVYEPTLPWFTTVDAFLRPIVTRAQKRNNAKQQDAESNASEAVPKTSYLEFYDCTMIKEDSEADMSHTEEFEKSSNAEAEEVPMDTICSPRITSVSSNCCVPAKRKKGEGLKALTSAIQGVESAIMNKGLNANEFDVFGQSVAAQLNSMPFEDALHLQLEIQQLITRTRMNSIQILKK